ncbi:hypothetical protein CXB51_004140 [Gossypium anomalum]|uniref:Reverse transcriptase Ty1/copia-type domain-containing protein n=1 Tax=Gossypium anomalum TaxID=47600 RepID=A0A8J5ZZM1_9ROSI|nr:hypothetical protein CXB51_004140 [Gossypium anomalum]
MKADGTIDKYKAKLVIKGYRQKECIDYLDTFSPVSRKTSIRMILAIVVLRNLEVHQMDVKTALLNRDLDEEIYMEQPEGLANMILGIQIKRLSEGLVLTQSHYVDKIIEKFGNDDFGVA